MKYWLFNRNPYKLHFRIPPKQKNGSYFSSPIYTLNHQTGPFFSLLIWTNLWFTLAWSISFLSAAICISKDCFNLSIEKNRSNGTPVQRKRFCEWGGRFLKKRGFCASCKKHTSCFVARSWSFFFGLGVIAFGDLERWELIDLYMCRWFKLTFLSPSWRSLNPWKGHLTIPKGHFESPGYCWYGESTII